MNLHGFTGRDADTDSYHQSDEGKADASTDEEAVGFQCRAVSPTVQLGMSQVEVDGKGYRSDDEQQQPSLAEQAGKHHPVGGSMCLVQGDFAFALLGTEPEGAEQAEEDVYEQERHAGKVVSHLIVLVLLEATTNILETSDITDKDIADTVLTFAICL